MRQTILAAILMMAVGLPTTRAHSDAPPCPAVEVSDVEYSFAGTYNKLVCEAVALMDQGRYRDAIGRLEEASELRLLNMPNYAVFPRLALAHHLTGEAAKAAEYLKLAELSLSLMVGHLQCQRRNNQFEIVDRSAVAIKSDLAKSLVQRMCTEEYEGLYASIALDAIASEAALIEYYLIVKRTIEAPHSK